MKLKDIHDGQENSLFEKYFEVIFLKKLLEILNRTIFILIDIGWGKS